MQIFDKENISDFFLILNYAIFLQMNIKFLSLFLDFCSFSQIFKLIFWRQNSVQIFNIFFVKFASISWILNSNQFFYFLHFLNFQIKYFRNTRRLLCSANLYPEGSLLWPIVFVNFSGFFTFFPRFETDLMQQKNFPGKVLKLYWLDNCFSVVFLLLIFWLFFVSLYGFANWSKSRKKYVTRKNNYLT